MRIPLIQEVIKREQKARSERLGNVADRLIKFWTAIAFTPIGELYVEGPDGTLTPKPLGELSEDAQMSISNVSNYFSSDGSGSQSIGFLDKMRASENLAKAFGMFIEKHQVFGKDGESLPININFIAPVVQPEAVTVTHEQKQLPAGEQEQKGKSDDRGNSGGTEA